MLDQRTLDQWLLVARERAAAVISRPSCFTCAIRADAEDDDGIPVSSAAQYIANQVAIHRGIGLAARRRAATQQTIQAWPLSIELEYANALERAVHEARKAYAPLLTEIPRILARLQVSRGDDARFDAGEVEFSRTLINRAKENMSRDITKRDVNALARFFGERTNRQQRAELARQLTSVLGVEVIPDDRWVPQVLEYFVNENASLITSVAEDLHGDVANLTARAFTKRMTPETYAKLLQKEFHLSESRARLIAADQLGSLHGQLNEVRQRSLGITHYFWRTRRDNRVRAEHRARDRNRYAWDYFDPDQRPGQPIRCRCTGDPDVTGILKAAEKRRSHVQAIGFGNKPRVPQQQARRRGDDDDVAAARDASPEALEQIDHAIEQRRTLRMFASLPIVIENPIGSVRHWTDTDGTRGSTTMKSDYGCIPGSRGVDGDEVDVYLGTDERAEWAYVIHQYRKPDFVEYDEDKVMLGFPSADAATAAYLAQYDDPRFLGGMSQIAMDVLRRRVFSVDGERISHEDWIPVI